jgi:hypothetical protein
MMRALHIGIVAVTASFFAPTHALADITVILRGGVEPVKGLSAVAALRGLEVQQGTAKAAVTIPWDMVRDVEGATIPGLESELAIGQDLWRARIRVERGDEALAEPLFTKHWERYRSQDGPTTAVIAEGLLRCALAKNDLRAAVEPWSVCLRIGSNGEPSRYPDLPGVLDDTTGLLPELSPFLPTSMRPDLAAAFKWAMKSSVISRVRAKEAQRTSASDQPYVAESAAGFLWRILDATERDAKPAPAAEVSRDAAPAVRALSLIEAILSAPDARAAAKAVAEFERILPDAPAYLSAWKFAAAGTHAARMARATTGDSRNRALEEAALAFLAVPASGLDKTGLVDAYALEEAVALLKESGDNVSAAQVATILDEKVRDARLRVNATSDQTRGNP